MLPFCMDITYVPTGTSSFYQGSAGEGIKMNEKELVSKLNHILGSHKLDSLSVSNLEEIVKHEPLETNDPVKEMIRTIYHLEANRNNGTFYSSFVKVLYTQVEEYVKTHKDSPIAKDLTLIYQHYSQKRYTGSPLHRVRVLRNIFK